MQQCVCYSSSSNLTLVVCFETDKQNQNLDSCYGYLSSLHSVLVLKNFGLNPTDLSEEILVSLTGSGQGIFYRHRSQVCASICTEHEWI